MSKTCETLEKLIPDYLEGVLDGRNRIILEKHLASCADCRVCLDLQREWLSRRDAFIAATDIPAVPVGLNDRIMTQVRAESATLAAGTNRRFLPGFHRPFIWRSLAGTAAAFLLLFAVWQLLPRLATASTSRKSADNEMTYTGEAASQDLSGKENITAAAKGNTETGADTWAIYRGDLRDLQAADCIFGLKNITPATTAGQVPTQNNPVSNTAADVSNDTAAAIMNILNESKVIRIMTRSTPPAQTLILAAFSDDEITAKMDLAQNALASCETPFQIEIIRTDDLPALLAKLGKTLYDKAFEQPAPESSWIFILIGA
jgi:hypothetical protein